MIREKFKQSLKSLGLFSIVAFWYHVCLKVHKKISNKFLKTGYILLYHRVDDLIQDPYLLSVGKKNFEEQIKFLKENYNVISLRKMVDDVKNKSVNKKSVVITFDDGYVDNYMNAFKILKKYNVPATIFVTVDKVDDLEPFYWDIKNNWTANNRCMNKEELMEMKSDNLIEFGSHSLSHPQLYAISESELSREIGDSKNLLESIMEEKINFFAYPFGGYTKKNDIIISSVRKFGYTAACENIPGRVKNNSDIFRLPRYVIRDWDLESFKENFKKFI